jgi:hypothetical protein
MIISGWRPLELNTLGAIYLTQAIRTTLFGGMASITEVFVIASPKTPPPLIMPFQMAIDVAMDAVLHQSREL